MSTNNPADQPTAAKDSVNIAAAPQRAKPHTKEAAANAPEKATAPPPPSSPIQVIAQAITEIIAKEKLQSRPKELLEGILKFIKETEDEECGKTTEHEG